jgi:hypothetical protein
MHLSVRWNDDKAENGRIAILNHRNFGWGTEIRLKNFPFRAGDINDILIGYKNKRWLVSFE